MNYQQVFSKYFKKSMGVSISLMLSIFGSIVYGTTIKSDYTYVILIESKNDPENFGSGLIVNHKNKCFIVTARHVARSLDTEVLISVNVSENKYAKVNLNSLCDSGIINWRFHDTADIAILEIDSSRAKHNNLNAKSINSDLFLVRDKEIPIGTPLKAAGFPHKLGSTFHPVVFESKIVNVKISDYSNEHPIADLFWIQPCFHHGSSGGPVLIDNSNIPPIIIGIAQGFTQSVKRGGNYIINLVTPAYYFFDFFDEIK